MRSLNAALFALFIAISASPAAADGFFFEEGIVTPSGQQITILRLPVRLSTGKLVYKDDSLRVEERDKIVWQGLPFGV